VLKAGARGETVVSKSLRMGSMRSREEGRGSVFL
jgi:hypothetical protein